MRSFKNNFYHNIRQHKMQHVSNINPNKNFNKLSKYCPFYKVMPIHPVVPPEFALKWVYMPYYNCIYKNTEKQKCPGEIRWKAKLMVNSAWLCLFVLLCAICLFDLHHLLHSQCSFVSSLALCPFLSRTPVVFLVICAGT